MLKRFCLLIAVVCTLVLVHPVKSADDLKGIVQKAIKAHGGAKLLDKYVAYEQSFKGTIDLGGMKLEFTMKAWSQAPAQMKNEISFSMNNVNFTMTQSFDGKKGWRSFNGMVQDLPEEQVKEGINEMRVNYLSGQLTPLLKDKYKLASFGDMKLDGKETTGIIVKEKGQSDFTLFFDKKTGLLAGVEYTAKDFNAGGEEVTQMLILSDYKKDKTGIMSPEGVHIKRDGKTFIKGKVTSTTFTEKLNKATFAKPD